MGFYGYFLVLDFYEEMLELLSPLLVAQECVVHKPRLISTFDNRRVV
jgi:hypothetical protein